MGEAEMMPKVSQTLWPSPVEYPLYVPVEKAAKIAGVRYEVMRQWVDAVDSPIPHIVMGKRKKLIRVAAIPEYMKGKEW